MIKEKIKDYLRNTPDFNCPPDLGEQQSLIEIGVLDSLSVIKLAGFIEETFKVGIDASDLSEDNFRSLSSLEKMIKNKQAKS